jgi:dTDP-D-glucose 4,6-dehydratase
MLFVTGGAGFIGANFVLDALARSDESILTLDKLTYAGNRENLAAAEKDSRHIFTEGDIGDTDQVVPLLLRYQPRAIVHFAAESHVDRSIHGPENFIQTNIEGTFRLLEAARVYWNGLEGDAKNNFRFLHISMDRLKAATKLSRKRTATDPTVPMPQAKPPPIILSAPGIKPMGCRLSSPTARTITDHSSFLKN